MTDRALAIICVGVFALATPCLAQEQSSASPTLAEAILRTIHLPVATNEARDAGVPEEEIREVLVTARERRVAASDIQAVLQEETKAVKEHGRIENFGAFVRTKLDQGLRGRALAEAIHAEHAARGMGTGMSEDKGSARAKGMEMKEAMGAKGKKEPDGIGRGVKKAKDMKPEGRGKGAEKKKTP